MTASTTALIGGRYRLVRVIGRGGMSDVYEAVDGRGGATVALKMVRSGDPALARRLAQEARALEDLDHPGLVRLLDAGESGDQAYLVMDLVDGSSLAEVLRRGPLGSAETATVGARLADALAYVHERGVVHRDLKPANILVTGDGHARLGDFGIAQLMDASTLTVAGTTLGTAAYMAPEQLEDHHVGPGADVWSLGLVLLECLTGRRTYQGTPSEVIAHRLAGPVPLPDHLPVSWQLLLTGMLDHRPDRRLDAAEVATLLGTSVFRVAWDPPPGQADDLAPTAPHDLTALAAAPPGTAAPAPPDTLVLASEPWASSQETGTRWWPLAALAILVAGLAVGLPLWLVARPAERGQASATTVPTRPVGAPRPATPTTLPPTTTTAAPTGATALARLVGDVASAVSAGTVQPGPGQAISTRAEEAVTDVASGRSDDAANVLQQAAMTIADGIRTGSIEQTAGATLQGDLSSLAAVLGVPAANPGPGTSNGPPAKHAHGPGKGG